MKLSLFLMILVFAISCASTKYPKKVEGTLSTKMIRSIIEDELGQFKLCGKWHKKMTNSTERFDLLVSFKIEKNGNTSNVKLRRKKTNKGKKLSLKVRKCFEEKMSKVKFPQSDKEINFNFPFYFQ